MEQKNKHLALLILRVSIGCLMLFGHGLPKIQNYAAYSQGFPDPIGLGVEFSLIMAIFTEVVLSAFLVVGLLTRFSTLGLAFTMLVAIFAVHLNDPWNKIEFAVLYLVPYVVLFVSGAGRYSLDAKLYRKLNSAVLEKLVKP